jgi:hypothetical protein
MKRVVYFLSAISLVALASNCASDEQAKTVEPAAPSIVIQDAYDTIPRKAFNQQAAEFFLPLFWVADENQSGALEPNELAILWKIDQNGEAYWVNESGFTSNFAEAYAKMASMRGFQGEAMELKRLGAIRQELLQGRPTLVHSDFSKSSAEDRAIVTHVLRAAEWIERIYAKQVGTVGMADKITDTGSQMVMYRNQGPWCVAPKTENDTHCHALKTKDKRISGLYPEGMQSDPKFCETLEGHVDQKTLMNPFVVVAEDTPGALKAVPYNVIYKEEMDAIATELEAAAAAIQDDNEAAFKAYLLADAEAFRTNFWEDADEAWARMNVDNSKWYLRLAPDEVYFDPCSRKAGFHVSFARINPDSLEWQRKLEPVKADMEQALADLAGPPYVAREVSFHLPDFIDIVLNAGNSRSPHGATIGQALPNWGPVANEGRGRTVAMTNLYTDPDSKSAAKVRAATLLCEDTVSLLNNDEALSTMSIVLHEAAHNLGPAHEYKVDGKTDDEVFGGPLASTLEELKAQTAALYFTAWLAKKKIIDEATATRTHVQDITWAFGHISRGMYTASGKPKAYSQLASMQVGYLLKAGALVWNADQLSANSEDRGCFSANMELFPNAIDDLAKRVLRIKGAGDKIDAEALKKEFVDDDSDWKKLHKVIQERWLRQEKASFVYSIRL